MAGLPLSNAKLTRYSSQNCAAGCSQQSFHIFIIPPLLPCEDGGRKSADNHLHSSQSPRPPQPDGELFTASRNNSHLTTVMIFSKVLFKVLSIIKSFLNIALVHFYGNFLLQTNILLKTLYKKVFLITCVYCTVN